VKLDPWRFPEMPAFLTGLQLEHLTQLRDLAMERGSAFKSEGDEGRAVKINRDPRMVLAAVVRPDRTDLLVVTPDKQEKDEIIEIDLSGTPLGGKLLWNWFVPLEAFLANLRAYALPKSRPPEQA
jgi:hypothetical protein